MVSVPGTLLTGLISIITAIIFIIVFQLKAVDNEDYLVGQRVIAYRALQDRKNQVSKSLKYYKLPTMVGSSILLYLAINFLG